MFIDKKKICKMDLLELDSVLFKIAVRIVLLLWAGFFCFMAFMSVYLEWDMLSLILSVLLSVLFYVLFFVSLFIRED